MKKGGIKKVPVVKSNNGSTLNVIFFLVVFMILFISTNTENMLYNKEMYFLKNKILIHICKRWSD